MKKVLVVFLFLGLVVTTTFSAEQPNVLLILTDDQGWGDIRSHGNELIDTPNMDRIAAEGARFNRFFVSPVCAPTRASLLSGRYHLRTGVHGVTRTFETMRTEETTLAEVLKANGYATGCFGKWHSGAHYPNHPNGQGFDEFVGFCGGHWTLYFDTMLERNGVPFKSEGYITDTLTDEAMRFIRKNRNQPFFCYVPYNVPHFPLQVPDRFYDKYRKRGCDETLATVYGMTETADEGIGKLLDLLDELKLSENTIVIFMTDNGANTDRFNGDMRGRKGSMHEGGTRVPCFIRFPNKIKSGTVIDGLAAHIDLLPTLVGLCGLPTPDTLPLDGIDLAPILKKGERVPDRTLFTTTDGKQGTVRTSRYRAVFEVGGNKKKSWQLYDMIDDPGQKKDVAEANPEIVQELSSKYERWLQDVQQSGTELVPSAVGHHKRSWTILNGHEAMFEIAGNPDDPGIFYFGNSGWANDWVGHWTDPAAYFWFPIEVFQDGTYDISLLYNCTSESVGSVLNWKVGDKENDIPFEKAFVSENDFGPNRAGSRECPERTWAEQKAGTVELQRGKTRLEVHLKKLVGPMAPEIKAVKIEKR